MKTVRKHEWHDVNSVISICPHCDVKRYETEPHGTGRAFNYYLNGEKLKDRPKCITRNPEQEAGTK